MIYLEGIYILIYIRIISQEVYSVILYFLLIALNVKIYKTHWILYMWSDFEFLPCFSFPNKGKSLLLCPFNKLILSCYVGSCGLIFFFTWGLLRVSSKRHIVWSNWYHIFMIAKSSRQFLWIKLAAPKKKNTCNWYQRVIIF